MKLFVICILLLSAAMLLADPPEYSFYTEPQHVFDDWYGYMPGGGYTLPMQVMENNNPGDNDIYFTFHAKESQMATRRQYLCYRHADTGTFNTFYIGMHDQQEGYGSAALDSGSNDPMVTWHRHSDDGNQVQTNIAWDRWHVVETPGFISTSYAVFPNGDWSGTGFTPPFADDAFIWPTVFVSEAPSFAADGRRRMYVFGRNRTSHFDNEYQCQNLLLAWVDFNTDQLYNDDPGFFNWSYTTIPQMDAWNAGEDWIEPSYGIAVRRDGTIGIIGYLRGSASQLPGEDPDLFVLWNGNYGEGEWAYHAINSEQTVPLLWDPLTGGYMDTDGLFFSPYYSSHINAYFDSDGRLHAPMCYTLQRREGDVTYVHHWYAFLREVMYNPAEDSINVYNLWPQGLGPSQEAFLPWDFDYDGTVDVDENEEYVVTQGWPIGHWEPGNGTAMNSFHMTGCPDEPVIAAVWTDGLKMRQAVETDSLWQGWNEATEIAISFSDRDGEFWREPIYLNQFNTPELADMTPSYVYPGSRLEYMGDDIYRLHLLFSDAYLGASAPPDPINCPIYYASIDVDLTLEAAGQDVVPVQGIALGNRPNPFNPMTQVEFTLPQPGEVRLDVFNVRGQKVCTLVQGHYAAGQHSATWMGNTDAGDPVGSGVYFARLQAGGSTTTHKLLLLK